jgi:hypothetical protein
MLFLFTPYCLLLFPVIVSFFPFSCYSFCLLRALFSELEEFRILFPLSACFSVSPRRPVMGRFNSDQQRMAWWRLDGLNSRESVAEAFLRLGCGRKRVSRRVCCDA